MIPPIPKAKPDVILSDSAMKATQSHSSPEGTGGNHDESSLAAAVSVTELNKVQEVTDKEQTRRDWEIIKKLIPNIWPKNDFVTKTRVITAISLLVGGKVQSLTPPARTLLITTRRFSTYKFHSISKESLTL